MGEIQFLLLTALLTLGLLIAARRMTPKRPMDELWDDEPRGLHKSNPLIWYPVKAIFLPVFGFANWWEPKHRWISRFIKKRLELDGAENIEWVLHHAKNGVAFVLDHRSSADVFIPQIILYLYGFKELAERIFFYIVGLKFVNRNWISFAVKGRDIIPIAPPTMIPQEKPKIGDPRRIWFRKQLSIAGKIISQAREEARGLLQLNRWMYLAPEGTRSKLGPMTEAPEGAVGLLDIDDLYIQTVALEGTENMWPIGKWPRPLTEVKMIAGRAMHVDEVRLKARKLSKDYGVRYERAFVDVIMRAIALLHIEKGNPWYAGFYAKPNEDRYERRQEWKER